jgi:hypothetical protein
MKNLIKISAAFILILVAFSSCKKDEKVIPDVTGSTYEVYKYQLGSAAAVDVTSSDTEYFKWKFVSGGILEDGNGIDVGTWSQNGEDVSVTYLFDYACKVSGNDLTASIDFGILGSYSYIMRKI